MIPISLAIAIGSVFIWGMNVESEISDHKRQMLYLREQTTRSYKIHTESMQEIEKMLYEINAAVSRIDGKVSIIEKQVR